ncbi:MAG: hypothetical protein HFJ37_05620 [Clostridia bacterium]|nr:hypothetical protein [Clostridia bacterium]
MARVAREHLCTSFFHVMVQGINKEFIFKNDRYINRYLQLMQENLKKEEIKLIAFCIMHNHAHQLIQVEDVEKLSIYMRRLNSMYAQYYNYMEEGRVGYVFRDRYKSEPITDKRQLMQCIKYIHQNPVKAKIVKQVNEYKYSSYQLYQNGEIQKYGIFTQEEIALICNIDKPCEDEFLDIDVDIEKKINHSISEFVKKEKIKVFEIFEKDDILKKLIKYLKRTKKINYTQIMKKLDITKGTMERLKK